MSYFLKAVLILCASVLAGLVVGTVGVRSALIIPGVVAVIVLGALILTKPYIGLVATMAALPLESLYSDLPGGTSVLSIIGLITITAYLVGNRFAIRSRTGFSLVYRFAIAFVAWLFLSNPTAAMGSRNWLFTYIQLLILMWLSAEELTPKRQRHLMLIFIGITIVPAILALDQARLSSTIYRSTRALGLVENANIFAMYLNIGIAFTLYFIVSSHLSRIARLAMVGVMILLMLAVVLSISRSGAIAFGTMMVFSIIFYNKLAAVKTEIERRRNLYNLAFIIIVILAAALIVIPPQYWSILEETRQVVAQGAEADRGTFGVRLELWQESLQLWRTSPITGIGIGRFFVASGHVVHNMYLQVLSELGIVGFTFLVGWLGAIVYNLLHTMYRSDNKELVSLAASWMLMLIAICVMGLSGSWQLYSKALWLLAGVSTVFIAQQQSVAKSEVVQQPQLVATNT